MTKPELLAPAGSLEKLQIAFAYGAEAVYLAGQHFGLRKSADNFTNSELKLARKLSKKQNKKIYVVLNGFLHNEDFENLDDYLLFLNKIAVDGLIISDPGVMARAQKLTTIPLHVSTQASVTNYYTALYWKKLGATRIITARELSIPELVAIKETAEIEVETFIHGAMCSSYSGKCVILNYTSGRDSNRGGCIQSCRHTYSLDDQDKTHIMNAKDLNAIKLIPNLIKAGIDSLKIEGRMKSNLYLANAVSAYRTALDNPNANLDNLDQRLNQVSNRTFTAGFLDNDAPTDSIHYDFNSYLKSVDFIGTVKGETDSGTLIELKAPLKKDDKLELLSPTGTIHKFKLERLEDIHGTDLESVNANRLIQIQKLPGASKFSVIRRAIK